MNRLGLILLGLWLIAKGVLSLAHLRIPGSTLVLDVIAIVAGVLLLIAR
jgi:ABC-type thiamin/hydroxymethylpyrimidine transport system permease subunit